MLTRCFMPDSVTAVLFDPDELEERRLSVPSRPITCRTMADDVSQGDSQMDDETQ